MRSFAAHARPLEKAGQAAARALQGCRGPARGATAHPLDQPEPVHVSSCSLIRVRSKAHLADAARREEVVKIEAAELFVVSHAVKALRVGVSAQRHNGDGLRFAAGEHAAAMHTRQQAGLGAARVARRSKHRTKERGSAATCLMGRTCSGERPSLRRRSSRSSCRIAFFCASFRAVLRSESAYCCVDERIISEGISAPTRPEPHLGRQRREHERVDKHQSLTPLPLCEHAQRVLHLRARERIHRLVQTSGRLDVARPVLGLANACRPEQQEGSETLPANAVNCSCTHHSEIAVQATPMAACPASTA